jgi:hypothetical protein
MLLPNTECTCDHSEGLLCGFEVLMRAFYQAETATTAHVFVREGAPFCGYIGAVSVVGLVSIAKTLVMLL